MGSDELITDAETQGVPEWAWKLSESIVLGNQGYGNAAVLIHRAFTAQLAEARESERAAMTEVNGLKDALAQVPEFICRKCGRRQDGPTDNEARF